MQRPKLNLCKLSEGPHLGPSIGESFVKTILASLLFAAVVIPLMSSDAEAYRCVARSANGSYGWGSHPDSLGYARRRALAECAIRTPRNYTCVLTECVDD